MRPHTRPTRRPLRADGEGHRTDAEEKSSRKEEGEIYEETCGVIKLNSIDLKCKYSTKRKHYHIGLIEIQPDDINKFYKNRELIMTDFSCDNYHSYLEKSDIKMFSLDSIFKNNFHSITVKPIKYYHSYLKSLQNTLDIRVSKSLAYAMPVSNKFICDKPDEIILTAHV